MPWNLAPSREAGPGVAAGAGGSPRAASGERVAGTVTSKWAKGGGPAGDEHYNLVFDTAQITSPDNRSHVRPGQPCPTIPANGHTPAIAGTHVRKLTPRECERLQGFPDDWTAVGHVPGRGEVKVSDTARYRALGNAVAVPVVEWIGRRMLACDDPAA